MKLRECISFLLVPILQHVLVAAWRLCTIDLDFSMQDALKALYSDIYPKDLQAESERFRQVDHFFHCWNAAPFVCADPNMCNIFVTCQTKWPGMQNILAYIYTFKTRPVPKKISPGCKIFWEKKWKKREAITCAQTGINVQNRLNLKYLLLMQKWLLPV